MKKILVIMIALFLAIPAISYAGSATSRWDLTIGGNVKFDVGWSSTPTGDQGATGNQFQPAINPMNNPNGLPQKYGNQLWGAGETGLNFFVKGPDAWGAKTSAFVAGDFTGFWTGGNNAPPGNGYGNFNLVFAEIHFDWPNTSLMFGQSPPFWGMLPTFTLSNAWNAFGSGSHPGPVPDQIVGDPEVQQGVGHEVRHRRELYGRRQL